MRCSKRPSRCNCLRPPQAPCWDPEGGSCRKAHQRMSRRRRGGACCRLQCWGRGSSRHASAPPPLASHRAGGPLLGLGNLPPTLSGTPIPTTHRGIRGEGRAAGGLGQPQPQSQPRATSLGGSGLISPGGGWLRAPLLAASSATTSLSPPPPTVGATRGGLRRPGTGARKPCRRFWLHLGRAH